MMASCKNIIYQRYLFKLSGSEEKRKSLKPKRNSWKQKYFIIYYENDGLMLAYYDKKPNETDAEPKGTLSLWPAYRITKIEVDKHACEIMTRMNRICIASNDETTIDELVFYLQTRTSLKDDLEGTTYSVFPENSNDHRRIGCVGNVCGLHISSFGLSLVIQENRSLVAQWPLRCVRVFKASGNGNFTFEAGRHAPFGPGVYEFQTRRLHDQEMYDLLNYYVSQGSSRSQALSDKPAPDVFTEIVEEYNKLKRLTVINAPVINTRPIRNSGIYDQIHNQQLVSGGISNRMACLEIESSRAVDQPPALPPRPPLASLNKPPPEITELAPYRVTYDEADCRRRLDSRSSLPPLPPRNPRRRDSRPVSQTNQYEDPDYTSVQHPLPASDRHNYQDIDEIIDALPPPPPPPSFTPPTPPCVTGNQINLSANNYEEIPIMSPPAVPIPEDRHQRLSGLTIHAYEDLDQIAPLESSHDSRKSIDAEKNEYSTSDRVKVRENPNDIFARTVEGDTYYTIYDATSIIVGHMDELEPQPLECPIEAQKPIVLPELGIDGEPNLESTSLESTQRKRENGRSMTMSVFGVELEKSKLIDKSLPDTDHGEGNYFLSDFNTGPELTLPKSEQGSCRSCLSPRQDIEETTNTTNISRDTYIDSQFVEDAYLDMEVSAPKTEKVIEERRGIAKVNDQDVYFDMSLTVENVHNLNDGNNLYFDVPSSRGTHSPLEDRQTSVVHVSSPSKNHRKFENDDTDTYFDMSGMSRHVTGHSECNEIRESQKTYTPLPFDVINLSIFEKKMLSRSTDDLDTGSGSEDDDLESLHIPRLQRSFSNPALIGEKSKSRISAFLYGTLRKKRRKKKKKVTEGTDDGKDTRYQKDKAHRASAGWRNKKIVKDITLARNTRSFVKSPVANDKRSKRVTYGGDLEDDIRLRERNGGDAPDYDVMSLGRRRPKHAISTPNLL